MREIQAVLGRLAARRRAFVRAAAQRPTLVFLVLTIVFLLLLMVVPPEAFSAPGDTTRIGEKVGNELASWGKGLILAVAALVCLPLLAKRDAGGIVVVALIALVAGGFVFAQGTVELIVSQFWQILGGREGG